MGVEDLKRHIANLDTIQMATKVNQQPLCENPGTCFPFVCLFVHRFRQKAGRLPYSLDVTRAYPHRLLLAMEEVGRRAY
jgi:hypothetical protein